MARTLREQMQDDLSSVFFNTDEFAEAITHWPLGDPTVAGDSLTGDVDRNNETNSGTGQGDAAGVDGPNQGSVINRAIRLELAASVAVVEQGQADQPSLFRLADGSYCRAVRIEGADDVTQTVLCTAVDRRSWGRLERP